MSLLFYLKNKPPMQSFAMQVTAQCCHNPICNMSVKVPHQANTIPFKGSSMFVHRTTGVRLLACFTAPLFHNRVLFHFQIEAYDTSLQKMASDLSRI